MNVLRICLFGGLRITYNGESTIKVTQTVQSLLAYMLIKRQRCHPREVLAGLFWGDRPEDQARSCLSTALWRLRRSFEPAGIAHGDWLLTTPTGEIGFNPASAHWLDVAVYEEQVSAVIARPPQAINADVITGLERAVGLYAGELLEGFDEPWAVGERERLAAIHINALTYLMRYHDHHGAYEESVAHGQQILQRDPLREETHRAVMLIHVKHGQRALALRQYEYCRQVLADELGIAPMPETQAVYQQIVTAGPHMYAPPVAGYHDLTLQAALHQLQLTMHAVDQLRDHLQGAMTAIGQLADEVGPSEQRPQRAQGRCDWSAAMVEQDTASLS
ncbi:MAG: AfsR/SARP family transcriptional regulator [Thermomicrobiales bacterium]